MQQIVLFLRKPNVAFDENSEDILRKGVGHFEDVIHNGKNVVVSDGVY